MAQTSIDLELVPTIKQYFDLYTRMNYQNPLQELLLKHGREFTPNLRPKGFRKMKDKECFSNATNTVWNDPEKYTYVEGYAIGIIPVHHAWVVDQDGNMIDPTWKRLGTEYFGICFDTEYLYKYAVKSGIYGILDNYKHRAVYEDDSAAYLRNI